MREKVRDEHRLRHILESIDNINSFMEGKTIEDFTQKSLLYFGVVKNLEIIGEAAYMLSREFIMQHPLTPWKQIIGMRHYLVHSYYLISASETWNSVWDDLPILKIQVTDYLKEFTERFPS